MGAELTRAARKPWGRIVQLVTGQPASPWVPGCVYLPIAAALVLWNLLDARPPFWAFIVLPLAGVLLWTLLEYVIHSAGFHWPSRSAGLLAVRASHGRHHDDPTDPGRIVARLSFTLPVAAGVYAVLCLVFWGAKPAGLVLAGALLGYLAYEVVHYRIHLGWRSRWLPRALVRHHLYHHHKDPSRCYGVTSPLWDWVFRTGRLPRTRRGKGVGQVA